MIRADTYHKYSSYSSDSDEDQLYILFDWNDGTSSGWLGPYSSGEKVNTIHKWTKKGIFKVRVKAKDINGTQSEWSDTITVVIPIKRDIDIHLLQILLDRLPILQRIVNL